MGASGPQEAPHRPFLVVQLSRGRRTMLQPARITSQMARTTGTHPPPQISKNTHLRFLRASFSAFSAASSPGDFVFIGWGHKHLCAIPQISFTKLTLTRKLGGLLRPFTDPPSFRRQPQGAVPTPSSRARPAPPSPPFRAGGCSRGRIWHGSDDDLHILQPGSSARARCNRSGESARIRREAANPIAPKPVSGFWFLTFSGNFRNIRHKD